MDQVKVLSLILKDRQLLLFKILFFEIWDFFLQKNK